DDPSHHSRSDESGAPRNQDLHAVFLTQGSSPGRRHSTVPWRPLTSKRPPLNPQTPRRIPRRPLKRRAGRSYKPASPGSQRRSMATWRRIGGASGAAALDDTRGKSQRPSGRRPAPDLTTGAIGPTLIAFSLPVLASNVLQSL